MTDFPRDESWDELLVEANLFDFLANVFLTLPDEAYVEQLRAFNWSDVPMEGCRSIGAFLEATAKVKADEVALELGRDRAALVRHMGPRAIEPPYESMYVDAPVNLCIGELNRFYADAGYAVSRDTRDTADQIGVEFAFLALVDQKMLEALVAGDGEEARACCETRASFEQQHIGRWAHRYAQCMLDAAQTDFYRGVAQIILEIPLG